QGRATSPSKSDANCCSPETSSCWRLLFLQSRIGKINPFLHTRLFKISVASGVRKHTGYVFGRDAPSPALLKYKFPLDFHWISSKSLSRCESSCGSLHIFCLDFRSIP